MEDASKAKASIAALNDFNLKGNRIRVEVRILREEDFSSNDLFECRLGIYDTTTQCRPFIVRIELKRKKSHFADLVVEQNHRVMNQVPCVHLG